MPPKLLLADDSITIQRVIELTFADEGIDVIAVSDGQQAIQRIVRERPDVILADIGMPGRDGYEVAAFVKGDSRLAHIPVLLLTGAFEPIDEPRARALGCDGVLVKPFEPQVVINRVRDLLAGRRVPELWPPPGPGGHGDASQGMTDAGGRGRVATASPDALDGTLEGSEDRSARLSGSLDAYFDHLDEVFTSPGTSPVPESTVARPMPASAGEPAEKVAEVSSTGRMRAARPPASPVVQPPPLADAFAALLAAEQGAPSPPPPGRAQPAPAGLISWSAGAGSPVGLSEETVDDIVERVLARMTDVVVRETAADIVSRVAERLVREEIERIKKSGV